jgi:hypothetical protein
LNKICFAKFLSPDFNLAQASSFKALIFISVFDTIKPNSAIFCSIFICMLFFYRISLGLVVASF